MLRARAAPPLLLALLCAASSSTTSSALFITIPYGEEECVREMVSHGANIVGSFVVESGGYMEVDAVVTDAAGKALYEAQRRKEDHFQLVAADHGEYTLCFGNTKGDRSEKSVEFHLHTEEEQLVDDKMAKIEHVEAVNRRLLRLADNVYAFKQAYDIIEVESSVQEAAAESTERRLFWCSLVESVVLVCMNVWQIRYMLSFFEVKRIV